MATTSDRRTAGGKIMRSRRAPPATRTPYARPVNPPEQVTPVEDPENPNWLSGLIYPAKLIASGAGKIFSLFGPNSSDSSSSSGCDSSGDDDDDDDDDDGGEEVENNLSFQGDGRLNKVIYPSSKSDNKRTLEQLVMQETFSREEGNELIKLIKSRVVNGSGTFDDNAANMRTAAIMEARKWLQEKRSGSKKKSESKSDVTNLATPSQVCTEVKGSPLDVAKSYMQNRPVWASPSLKLIEGKSLSPLRMQRFMEETPMSSLRSSELKRGSLTSGSWNILEEIRRVRSKATEELLAATPLTKITLSSLSPENNHPQESLKNETDVVGAVVVRAESSHGRPQEVMPDAVASLPSRVNQDGGAIQSMELQDHQEVADFKLNEDNKVNDHRSTTAENGFSTNVTTSFAAGDDETPKSKPLDEENRDLADSSHDVHVVELTTDVLTTAPSETVVNAPQNNTGVQREELSQPIAEQPSRSQTSDTQKERKSRGLPRRGRGRGRGK